MSEDPSPNRYDRALAFCQMGRVEDAEKAIRELLREDPGDPIAHAALSSLLLDLDRPSEALESASAAIALAPDLSVGHEARAWALVSLDRFEEAEDAANEAVRADPEDADPWIVLTSALVGQGRVADAISAADHALAIEPDSEAARGLQAVMRAMSEGESGWKEAADQTLAVAPDSARAHAFAAHAHLLRGGERQAAEHFREALRLDPESEFAQEGLAEAMKAEHPLYRPIFRFFVWQERLSRGWKIAITVGPLLAVRALRPAAPHNPFVIGLIALWFVFVALTWLAVPIANVALRFSAVGRAVLPTDEKRSSTAFLAFMGAALLSVVFAIALQGGWALAAFTDVLLAFVVGSAHGLSRTRRRVVYAAAFAAGVLAFAGGALLSVRVGDSSLGAIIIVAALLSALALVWTVRLS